MSYGFMGQAEPDAQATIPGGFFRTSGVWQQQAVETAREQAAEYRAAREEQEGSERLRIALAFGGIAVVGYFIYRAMVS